MTAREAPKARISFSMGAASSKKNASLPQEQSIDDVPHGESLGCAPQRMAAGQKSAKSRFEMTGALRKSCPLISIYRDTRGMDHVHLRPLCPKPVRQPETSGHLLLFGPPGGGQSGFALVEKRLKIVQERNAEAAV